MTSAQFIAARHMARLSQAECARLLRIANPRTLRRWELGEVPVPGPVSVVMELVARGELPNRFFGHG